MIGIEIVSKHQEVWLQLTVCGGGGEKEKKKAAVYSGGGEAVLLSGNPVADPLIP